MLSQFCSNLLQGVAQDELTGDDRLIATLDIGVAVRNEHSIKVALVMLEVLRKELPRLSDSQKMDRWEHFVDYLFANYSQAVAMAIVKYAISARKIAFRGMAESRAMKRITPSFNSLYLSNRATDRATPENRRFQRIYQKLLNLLDFSDQLQASIA